MGDVGRWTGRILLAGAAVVLAVVGVGPLTGTYRLATVLTGSMAPGMPVGSVAVLVPEDPAAVRVGDVITFQAPTPDHRVVTHRVVEVVEGGHHPVVRTKGDANQSADPWSARLAGRRAWRRVAVIPYAGTAIRLLRSRAVHRLTVQVVPVVLLAWMLAAIWLPGRLSRRQTVAVVAAVVFLGAIPAAMASFTNTASATNTVASAADYVAPSVASTVIGKLYNSSAQYLASSIRQGGTYYVYANVTDSGNPASGVSTVTADVSAITTGSTALALTAGSYSVNGVSYGYRSNSQSANGSLSEGAKSYTITSTDAAGFSQTQSGYTVTVDNNVTAFAASDIQTANHAGGTVGTAEQNDTITFTFNKSVDPQSILSGWTGASTSVVVRLQDGGCVLLNIGCSNDTVQIYNSANTVALPFGTINLNATDYTGGGLTGAQPDTLFGVSPGTASTMVLSGSTITITLGTGSGSGADNGSSTKMTWSPSTSPYDAAGNQMSATAANESGLNNKEF